MSKIFAVYHVYDVDGGFGDAIGQKKLLFTTPDENVAKKYVKDNSNDHIYDIPYSELHCGELIYEELPTTIPDPNTLDYLKDNGWCRNLREEDDEEEELEFYDEN